MCENFPLFVTCVYWIGLVIFVPEMHDNDSSCLELLKNHWRTCIHCCLIFPLKSHRVHEKNCQGQKSIPESILLSKDGCIASGILYAMIVIIKERGFLKKYRSKKKPVVLMHPSTMRLLNFHNGGTVLVHGVEDESVHRSWACNNVEVGCISFVDSHSFKWNPGDKASLYHHKKASDIAARIYLFPRNQEEYMLSETFKVALLQELDHVFTRVGAAVSFHYLGVPCEFSVVRIVDSSEIVSQSEKPTSRHFFENGESATKLTAAFSNLSLRAEQCDVSNATLNCLLHHKPSLDAATAMPSETVPQCSDINSYCKINSYFIITKTTKIFIENSAKSEVMQKMTFNSIYGLREQLQVIRVIMDDLISQHYKKDYESLYTGVLLSGPSGTGKTLVAQAIASEYECRDVAFITLHQSELNNRQYEINIRKVKEKFKDVVKRSPSVFFIDDVDQVFPKECSTSATSYQNRRLTMEVVDLIDEIVENPHCSVLILAATRNPENINPLLLKLRRIDKEIKFGYPDLNARYEILKELLTNFKHSLTGEQVQYVAKTMEHYSGSDLSVVFAKAAEYASTRYFESPAEANLSEQIFVTFSDVTTAIKELAPSVSKELIFNIPKVQWNDIGGMCNIKEEIKQHFDLIFGNADAWKKIGITPARGFLMYGPPGCSKTMIAMAIANEIKANFIPVKGPELLNKYVGESEKAMHQLFLTAKYAAPCVIYFDEIDSIAIQRKSHDDSSKVDERVLSQLLIEMSGIDTLEGVVVVASTNKPHMIDSALLRSGRFDLKIYVPLPDSLTRKEILQMKLKGISESEIDWQDLIERTQQYSCAEIVALCDQAVQLFAVGEISSAKSPAFMCHFHQLLDSNSPKTSRKLLDVYEKFSSSVNR